MKPGSKEAGYQKIQHSKRHLSPRCDKGCGCKTGFMVFRFSDSKVNIFLKR